MRDLVVKYLSHDISRRKFVKCLTNAGLTVTAANSVLASVGSVSLAQAIGQTPAEPAGAPPSVAAPAAPSSAVAGVKSFQGPGGACFVEQLIASGVKYVFGNSASEDAQFYEALVDRPQLKYILTPHEGPGAAMAAGYIKASGEPAIVMQAAVVGMANAIGQIFNAFKEQTPLLVYSYRTDQSRRAGRDGFEEAANQEQIVQPITKYTWLARRADMIPETIRRGFKAAWTPPYGPAYISWHSDYNDERVRTDIIEQRLVDPRMRVRTNPDEVQRAARLLVEARMPLLIVGDEIHNAKAESKAVKLGRDARHAGHASAAVVRQFSRDPSALGRLRAGWNPEFADLAAQRRRDHQCGQQVPAQQPGADLAARAEIHRHAHRLCQHGQRDADRGAAGRRRRAWPR
jgi:Thiamine pyrophosphate enzyme, N-terminal TPP binding domain